MALLFGNAAGRNQSKNLVEFRAGKMQMKGNTVHAEKRKGLVYVHQTEDSLMHFCWKDRTTGTVEDDLIIFPDDVEFKRVQQCTTGRVYLLKFKSSNRKLFFWMQDPKTDKDDDNCSKVNEYLNNPPVPGSARSGGSTPGAMGADDTDLQNLLSTMSQQQFMQLLGGVSGVGGMANLTNYLSAHGLGSQFGSGSSSQSARRSGQTPSTTTSVTSASATTVTTTTAAVTTGTTSTTTVTSTQSSADTPTTAVPAADPAAVGSGVGGGSSQVQLSDLQSILSGISVQSGDENAQPLVAAVAPRVSSSPAVDLSTAMTADVLQPILSNPQFLERLQSFLPQTGETSSAPFAEQLQSTVQSPQFQQAVSMFSAALQSGQLGPLLQQFGLNEEVVNAAAQGDMETFIGVLQASQNKDKDEDKKDDDEDMALD